MAILKWFLIAAGIGAACVAGDYYNVLDRFVYPFRYAQVKIEKGFYQKPFDLEKVYVRNTNGNLETYLGNEAQWVKVDETLFQQGQNKEDKGVVDRTLNYLDETVDYLLYLHKKFNSPASSEDDNGH